MTRADAIVVGLGAMGSAAAFQLARRGARVLGIDRFAPPHDQGSSHGETRITRLGVGEGAAYVPLVRRAHEIWREVEAETGVELFRQCGGLVLAGARSHHPRKTAFLDSSVAIAQRFGIAHELLSAAEIAARFPQFILDGDERGYFEPSAGMLFPERCIAAQLDLAVAHGATIRTGEIVLSVEQDGAGVAVRTDKGSHRADAAIVCAGAWNPGLVGPPLRHMRLHRQVLHWFETDRPEEYEPGRFPVFIQMHGEADDQSYGFPIPPGSEGVKVASESFAGGLDRPEEVDRVVRDAEAEDAFRKHVAPRLRWMTGRILRAKTCLYTQAPDDRFFIDAVQGSDRVTVVSACSGHGFKHSAAIGEALAERVLEGRSALDLSPFGRRAADEAALRG